MGHKGFRKKSDRKKDFFDRRSLRYSQHGRDMECRVNELLKKKLEEGQLHSFYYVRPHSREDRAGCDFTVRKQINGSVLTRHFGITISPSRHNKQRVTHPDIPCILIPFEMRDERIWARIEELFI